MVKSFMKLATGVNVESLFYTINDEHVLVHDKFLGYLSISRGRAEPTRAEHLPYRGQRYVYAPSLTTKY